MPFGVSGNIYLFGAIGQGLGPVVLTPLLTRNLTTIEFGEVTFVNASASILGILFTFGLPIVISRAYVLDSNSHSSINNWFKKIIYFYLLTSTFLLIFNFNSIYVYIFAIALNFSCLQLILPLARAQNKPIPFAFISILGTLLPSFFVLLNKYLSFTFSNIVALQLGAIFSTLISYFLVKPINQKDILLIKYSLKNSLKNSYTILPHMFAMIALMNIDKVIFGQVLGKEFSGYIQIIMLVATSPIMIISALNHAWLNQILLQLKNNSNSGFYNLNLTILRLFVFLTIVIVSLYMFYPWIIKLLNPNIQITSTVSNTIILSFLTSFIYVIYLANTHLLTWLNRFWILGLSTPISVIFQSVIMYVSLDSLGYLAASIGLGAALSFQIIFLQLYRNKTDSKNAIRARYQYLPIVIFWFAALYFLN